MVSLPGASSPPWITANKDKLNLLQLCKKFEIELREQNSEGHNIFLMNGKCLTVEEIKKDPKIGPQVKNFLDHIDHLS